MFAVFAAPTVLSGQATFAGYTVLGDTSIHMIGADALLQVGRDFSSLPPSSYEYSLVSYYGASGYPSGGPTAAGALTSLVAPRRRLDVPGVPRPARGADRRAAVVPADAAGRPAPAARAAHLRRRVAEHWCSPTRSRAASRRSATVCGVRPRRGADPGLRGRAARARGARCRWRSRASRRRRHRRARGRRLARPAAARRARRWRADAAARRCGRVALEVAAFCRDRRAALLPGDRRSDVVRRRRRRRRHRAAGVRQPARAARPAARARRLAVGRLPDRADRQPRPLEHPRGIVAGALRDRR